MKLIWFVLFLGFQGILYSQEAVSTVDEATSFVLKAMDSARYNPGLSLSYLDNAETFFEDAPNSVDKINFHYRKGEVHSLLGEYDIAKTHFDIAFSNALALEKYSLAIEIQGAYVLRCVIITGADLNEPLKLALEINRRANKYPDKRVRFFSNRLLIDIYWDMAPFKNELLELTIKNDELASELEEERLKKNAKFDLGYAYGRIEKYDLAIKTYAEVAKMQLKENDYFVSATYNNIAAMYQEMHQEDSAIYYYQLGMKYALLQGRDDGVAASNLYIGKLYLGLKQFELAKQHCATALQIFKDASILRRQEECAACLQEAYEKLGDKTRAYDFIKLKIALDDSLNVGSDEKNLKQIQTEFNHGLQILSDSLDFAHKSELKETIIEQQNKRSMLLYIGLFLVGCLAFFIFNRFRLTQKQKVIIEKQSAEVAKQHHELIETHKEITDSISYAKRIQSAILPPDRSIEEVLGQAFVLYEPKDVVAGDFYWIQAKENAIYFAAADCTGHGVPGALVSVICNGALNRALKEFNLDDPGIILDKAREIVIEEFSKSDDNVKDGMDIALCKIVDKHLFYAGAHNPLWIIRNGEIIETKANKEPIGKFDFQTPFNTHHFMLEKGDQIYVFSDGYVDQFGGEKGKKLKSKKMREIFLANSQLSISQQKGHLLAAFQDWKGNREQVDDVCIVGVRI